MATYAAKLREILVPMIGDFDPPNLCWVGRDDDGEDYCPDCAHAVVAERLKTDPEGDWFKDGGWGGQECDSACFCARCGRILDHSFTDYGVADETECVFDGFPIATPESAWRAVRLIDIYHSYDGDYKYAPAGTAAMVRKAYDETRRALKSVAAEAR